MILPVATSMITMMLVKFMFNDVPHYLFEEKTMHSLKVTHVDERGATGPQLRYIALLSARLKIPEPVVKGFGEAGSMITHLKKEEQERKRLKSNPAPTGTCYEDAWRYLMKEESGQLIHGTVLSLGKRMNHAWVETDAGYIWEPQTGGYFAYNAWQAAAEPVEEHRYTTEEAAIMLARTGKHGPWTDKERASFI